MLFKSIARVLAISALLMTVCGSSAMAVSEATFLTHEIELTLDVPAHAATFVDRGTMQTETGWNFFQLNANVRIDGFLAGGNPVEYLAVSAQDLALLPAEARPATDDIDTTGKTQIVAFESQQKGEAEFEISYHGEFFQDASNARFSNEKVGMEIKATISEQGAYLGSEAYYFPVGREQLASFTLAANIPQEWESISDGNRLDSETISGRKLQTWQNPYQSDGLTFFAAPFIVGQSMQGEIGLYCYFFPEDSQLIDGYLRATGTYIRMYEDLIGPYPYRRFTVAENFFPTGYGMPGWTLLGQQVLRLPFIVATSLGHEVLHNWWGNSVFVDYEKGNWCEGITVYGADYRYKFMQSRDEARDYRKNILKQYVSYINEGNDFPLREFTARSDPGTRTIGYNKSMMVFHMIENLIGTEPFFNAWKAVYRDNIGKKVSWEDWIAAFEASSGKDLSFVIPQWIDRAGAPMLAASIIEEATLPDSSQRSVRFRLRDDGGQGYRLQVPVRIWGGKYNLDTSVTLDGTEAEISMMVSGKATTLAIDPDYSLFRKLYPEEVEPVIAAILGNPNKAFLHSGSEASALAAFGEYGLNMTGDSVSIQSPEKAGSANGRFAVILADSTLPEYLEGSVIITGDTVTVAGVAYQKSGHTFVLSGQNWQGYEKYLVLLTTDYASLPRIGQLIPHYGKYSYLVFEGPKNVGKGQWEPESSPLILKLAQQ